MTGGEHETARELLAALRRTQERAELYSWESSALLAHGYEIVTVRGLPSVLWRKNGTLFTTDAALSEALAIEEDRR